VPDNATYDAAAHTVTRDASQNVSSPKPNVG
jgi:hypothetical protein